MRIAHRERHRSRRIGWLRAAVLGANDGILSTASLIVGVAAAQADHAAVLTAGVAALVAGSMSMAAGEYVSVSSQLDTEHADLKRERLELATDVESERAELAGIYVHRGLDAALARQVADQLMAKDALGAHARDELGISEISTARPIQAALDFGGDVCRRFGVAAAGRRVGAAHIDRLGRQRGLAGFSRRARHDRGAHGRRFRHQRRPAHRVLGRYRDGGDSGYWCAVRHDGVMPVHACGWRPRSPSHCGHA